MIKLSRPNITKEAMQEVCKVLESGMLVQGEKVLEFETELKKYINVDYVSAVSSGTAALHLALEALEIGQGDAVLVPDFTFVATANVVEIQKARTVLVDVDSSSYNMCPDKLEETISNYNYKEQLKAIIVVHEFGAPADMTRIMAIAKKYNLYVIEDAACALGAYHNEQHVGTFGDIGCFSFHPRKSITTGEGGALITNNEKLARKVELLRNHGLKRDENGLIDVDMPGYNYRMTDFQAILGISQLKTFQGNLVKRSLLVDNYFNELSNIESIKLPRTIEGHAWQSFMIILNDKLNRSFLIEKLYNSKIEAGQGAQAISKLSYFNKKYKNDYLKNSNSEILAKKGLVLPLDNTMNAADIKYICLSLAGVIKAGDYDGNSLIN
ncbi:DegT/DnrJ/EryC1/StrS family aminotransferase [Lysinibacillus sp. NPDC093692]|uniref:DegT/DnrJ/EryC1/StrS family aminotransferase n=1 Tax=Lysinibacillus sp. NPDC093692 TaxID=3390578 RepID=UPI003D00F975